MQDQDAVADDAVGVLPRRADGPIVNLHFGHALAAGEREIARDEIAFHRRGKRRGLRECDCREKGTKARPRVRFMRDSWLLAGLAV